MHHLFEFVCAWNEYLVLRVMQHWYFIWHPFASISIDVSIFFSLDMQFPLKSDRFNRLAYKPFSRQLESRVLITHISQTIRH